MGKCVSQIPNNSLVSGIMTPQLGTSGYDAIITQAGRVVKHLRHRPAPLEGATENRRVRVAGSRYDSDPDMYRANFPGTSPERVGNATVLPATGILLAEVSAAGNC